MNPSLRRSLLLGCLMLWGGACLSPRPSVSATDVPSRQHSSPHLVIDAGSTGTRFLLYEVRHEPRGCIATPKELPKEEASGGVNQGGLAQMCANGTAVAWLKAHLPSGLGAPPEHVVLLGTGGFRNLRSQENDTFQQCWTEMTTHLEDRIGRMDIITGEQEGTFAWMAMEQWLTEPSKKGFSILEMGGVSVQFATGVSRPDVISKSKDGVGFKQIRKKLNDVSNNPCQFGEDNPENFVNCRDAMETLLRDSAFPEEVKGLPPEVAERPVYGVGEAWQKFANELSGEKLSSQGLEGLGKNVCEMKTASEKCISLAYTSALLKVMNITTIHWVPAPNHYLSWTQGAAIHEVYFPDCR